MGIAMGDRKQVEPFIIFAFWMAILFGHGPGGLTVGYGRYLTTGDIRKLTVVLMPFILYAIFTLVPLCVGIRRLRAEPAKYSGRIHAVVTLLCALLVLWPVVFIVAYWIGKR